MRKVQKIIKYGSEEYREIVAELSQGHTRQEIAKAHGVRRMLIMGIQKTLARRLDAIAGGKLEEHLATVTLPRAIAAIDDGLVDPTMYNPAKIGVSVAKGLGIFKPAEEASGPKVYNHLEVNIVQQFNSLTPEERQEKIALARKARLALLGPDGVLGGDDRPQESHRVERNLVGA